MSWDRWTAGRPGEGAADGHRPAVERAEGGWSTDRQHAVDLLARHAPHVAPDAQAVFDWVDSRGRAFDKLAPPDHEQRLIALATYGDLDAFAAAHAPEGLILYVEVAGDGAVDAARDLWSLRLTSWFDLSSSVLVGRTAAPPHGLTQEDAVRSALAGVDVPVVLDVDCGHVPPHMVLVNGALAEVVVDGDVGRK